jgi:hypothetical protein
MRSALRAWDALGIACQKQEKSTAARDAFQHAIAANPAALLSRVHLIRAEITLQLWPEAVKSAQALIDVDATHRYPEAYLLQGIAHQLSHDMEAARISFRVYLERVPNAPNAAAVKAQLDEPSIPGATAESSLPVQQALLVPPPEPEFTPGGEAWLPGGRKALAAIARLNGVPGTEDFFVEYCRSIAAQTSRTALHPIPGYTATAQAYVATVATLMDLGERKEDRAVFTLSLNDAKTPRILALLGWKVVHRNGAAAIEPGDQPADGPRQQIPAALGIDEAAMQAALEAGRMFQFEILSENAPLVGGASWGPLLQAFAGAHLCGSREHAGRDSGRARQTCGTAHSGDSTRRRFVAIRRHLPRSGRLSGGRLGETRRSEPGRSRSLLRNAP